MLLYTNSFFTINLLEVQNIITFHFYESAKNLNQIFLQAELKICIEKMIKRFSSLFFVDILNIETIFDNEFIFWFENTIINAISNQNQIKVVWITSNKEFFQFLNNNTKSLHNFFNNHKQATEWLLEGINYEFGKKHKHHKN